jgi:hypothetical protein
LKRFRNELNSIDANRSKLPDSIKSLYESISSAQEELAAGRDWSEEF